MINTHILEKRSFWTSVSTVALLAVSSLVVSGEEAQAADCHVLGGNQFTVDGPGADLDGDCTGATDGATVTVTKDITNVRIVDSLAAPGNWNVKINPLVTLETNDASIPIVTGDDGMTVTNEGNILKRSNGRVIAGENAGPGSGGMTVINRGSIIAYGAKGTNSIAIESTLPGTTTVDNQFGGFIEGRDGAIVITGGAGVVTNAGILGTNNSGAGAVVFSTNNTDDVFNLRPTGLMDSYVDANNGGNDTLNFLDGTRDGQFDLTDIDTGTNTKVWRGFENFNVKSGRWEFSGGTTQSFNVLNGATMAGNGLYDALNVFPGGILAPGTIDTLGSPHIGTITATGDVLLQSGSIFQPKVDPAGASDLLYVTGFGALSIAAGAKLDVVALPGGVAPTTGPYRIITTQNNITGTFSSVTDNVPDIDFTPIYNAQTVDLQVVQAPTTTTQSPKTILVAGLGNGVESSLLFNRTTRRQANANASGASNASAFTESEKSGGSKAFAALQEDGSLWGAPLVGQSININDSNTALGYDSTSGGLIAGLDRRFSTGGIDFLLGASGGLSWTGAVGQQSKADLFAVHAGAFGTADFGALDLAGAVSVDTNKYDIQRYIGMNSGGAMIAKGSTTGYSMSFATEATLDLLELMGNGSISVGNNVDLVSFGPMVGFEHTYSHTNAFTESGAGLLNLSVGAQDNQQSLVQIGVDVKAKAEVLGADVAFDGRVALEHELQSQSHQTATSLAALPALTYNAAAAPLGRNRLMVGLGATLKHSDKLSATVRYDARLLGANSSSSHQFSAGLKLRF